ncbi:MAG TPA: S8 family serine peptidase [Steroidobacteraceae bacterium]|nr:S8 family serine peptidase [Steroidobacteraceae bacterium]
MPQSAPHASKGATVDVLRYALIGLLASFSLSFTSATAGTAETNPILTHPAAAASQPAVIGFLVKLRAADGISRIQAQSETDAVQSLAKRANLTFHHSRRITAGLHLLQVSPGRNENVAELLARLRADPAVESVDVDERRYPHALPNDPLYVNQWYEQNVEAAAIDAVTAWDTTTGRSDIVIADLDTGVRFDHPDLGPAGGARLLAGYDFITNPAVANDGDGRDADASDPGDWVTTADTQTSQFSGCTVANSSWHGTRTAGILGALTNNSAGIAGITWGTRVLPVRVLGKCGGADSDILDGMRWAAGLHVDGVPDNAHPAQIINMSLGSTGACTGAEQIVINEVLALGVLVVVSAGNEGGPVDAPANCVGVAAVAGLRNVGTKVGYSSLGPEIALSAPAGNCVTTGSTCLYPIDTTTNSGTTTPVAGTYTDQNNPSLGTSFAAPMVSGIAALMASVNSNLTGAQLIARLKEGAVRFPVSTDTTVPTCHVPASASDLQTLECNCTTQTCGAGMANAPGALQAALRPIAAIAVPGSVSSGQNVVLSAIGSAAACGHTISGYMWSAVGSGTIAIQGANSASATVVAPSSGPITIQVTVTDDAGLTDTAQVVISTTAATTSAPASADNGTCPAPATPVAVSVSPATATVQAGGSQVFRATVTNTANTAVSWQVNGITGGTSVYGTITSDGVYTAPATVSSTLTATITAVSGADSSRTGSSQVTVNVSTSGGTTSAAGVTAGASGGGGGGGGAIDGLTLLVGGLLLGRRGTCRRLAHLYRHPPVS